MLLDLRSAFLALPVTVIGLVLAATGEEYYQALTRSLGHARSGGPGDRWRCLPWASASWWRRSP